MKVSKFLQKIIRGQADSLCCNPTKNSFTNHYGMGLALILEDSSLSVLELESPIATACPFSHIKEAKWKS